MNKEMITKNMLELLHYLATNRVENEKVFVNTDLEQFNLMWYKGELWFYDNEYDQEYLERLKPSDIIELIESDSTYLI